MPRPLGKFKGPGKAEKARGKKCYKNGRPVEHGCQIFSNPKSKFG
jgi:hypothetical protein